MKMKGDCMKDGCVARNDGKLNTDHFMRRSRGIQSQRARKFFHFKDFKLVAFVDFVIAFQ